MKAIRVTQHGGPEVLRYEDAPSLPVGPGKARIKLKAIGLNFIDIYQRRGAYPVQLPWTPGLEGAGVVEEAGAGVIFVKPGDRVAYTSQPGAYAEESVVDADSLIKLPDQITFEQGAALPLQGMTAHYLINEYRKPKPGDNVLIHAAAGGMGLLLCQWARHLGARVIGTVSTEEKAEAARAAGAHDVINYINSDFVEETKRLTNGKGVELIIDGVGKTTFAGDLEAAAMRGWIVIFGSASGPANPIGPNDLQKKSLTVSGGSLFNYLLSREELEMRAKDVIDGVLSGWLKLNIGKTLPLESAAEAHRILEGRESIGKIILTANN